MSRSDGRVRPGQKLDTAFSARAWNRAQDAADLVLGQRPNLVAEAFQTKRPPFTALPCKNTTGAAVPRWGILAITGLEVSPSGQDDAAASQFQAVPVLSGSTPSTSTNDLFGIAIEPIASQSIGMVAVDGYVQAKVEIRNADDTTAGPKASTAELVSGGVGATIVWKQSGTGTGKWALLKMGQRAAVRLGTISATWTKGTTATVTQQTGSGNALVPATTFSAKNYFATVTVPSGTRRVACALIDDTWVLVAAEC